MASKGKAPEAKNLLPKNEASGQGAEPPAGDGDQKNSKMDKIEEQVNATKEKLQKTM
jgi:hypothetical protein